tara:strand:+ start:400 stop:732 length:333 start_codon:yes stop_codon:yes gene_type:complete
MAEGTEENTVSKKINIEVEIDPTVNRESKVNPYQKWIHLAKAVDSWRIFPRLFLTIYIVLLYRTVNWFMELASPSLEQSGLISVVVGAGAAWFGLYAGTSKQSSSFKGDK